MINKIMKTLKKYIMLFQYYKQQKFDQSLKPFAKLFRYIENLQPKCDSSPKTRDTLFGYDGICPVDEYALSGVCPFRRITVYRRGKVLIKSKAIHFAS